MGDSGKYNWIVNVLKKLGYRICVLINAVLMVFILPATLILLSPQWVLRYLVKILAKIFRPDLCDMVTCVGNSCANTNNNLEKPRNVIVVKLLLSEVINFEQVLSTFRARAVERKDENGEILYPEMKQYLTSWLGFRFWTRDNNYNIRNHIQPWDGGGKEFVTQVDMTKFEEYLLSKSFHLTRSPWELYVISNTRLNLDTTHCTTALFVRFSHILADGYSVKKLLEGLSEVKEFQKLKMNYPTRRPIDTLIFPFKFIYSIAEINVMTFMYFPFKTSDSKKSFEHTLQITESISVQAVKDLKNHHNISFSSAIFGIVTGVLRAIALENGMPLTETLPCIIPLPKSGHPLKLRNHFTMAMFPLPIGEPDPLVRLQLCHQQLNELKKSVHTIVADFFLTLYGGLFGAVGKIIGKNNFSAVNVSYLPSGLEACSFNNARLIGQTFCIGIQKGSIGAVVTVSSFQDQIVMHAIIDSNVVPREKVLRFNEIVKKEMEILKKLSICEV